MIYTLYFSALYSSEEQDKIDLCSPTFYWNALDFYCKNGSESERKRLLQGIRILSCRILEYDNLIEVKTTWEKVKALIWIYELRENIKPKTNLATEFKNEVNNILETTKAKIDESRNNEINLLRKKMKRIRI